MPLSPGTRVRRYEVTHLLGAGGMGEVYCARDVELDREVALKILPDDGGVADAERVRRFLQEARAAISLSHPNVAHIYDAGDDRGVRFMAMEYVQGETLRARISRTRLSLDDAIDIALQIASALGSAHAAGIVHRDIKPENVMLRPDGYVKVLDFGLAKLTVPTGPTAATQVIHTAPGLVMGTPHYMSPEQLRGADVDARTDIFSLGVLLYELLSGRRPFEASTPTGVIAAILTEEPKALEHVPEELRAVVSKALAKDPEQRYRSAREMSDALKKARGDSTRLRSGDIPTQVLTTSARGASRRTWRVVAAASVVVIAIAVGAWLFLGQQNIERARASIENVERLSAEARYFEAWDLAQSLRPILGDDAGLTSALQKMSEELTVTSAPSGANVYLQRVLPDGSEGPRALVGTTPLTKHPIARGNYILTVTKDGYAERARPVNTQPLRVMEFFVPQPPPPIEVQLLRTNEVPARMVRVDGGSYALTGWMRTSNENVQLDPFFIDRYEVSNREFEDFVRAGGYRRRELWKEPFVKDGKTLSFDEAMAFFRDTTGLHGPRSWAQGKYPPGLENHPVTDITWYEAAAYAEHAGKKLPTLFQWDKAARNGMRAWAGHIFPWGMVETGADVTPRANFRGAGLMPVESLAAGMSVWGVHHLAGNVAELLRNRVDDGIGATGGGFDDAAYQFGQIASYPGFFSSPKLGFRCVRETGARRGDQGAFALVTAQDPPPTPRPATDAEFARLRRAYDHARTPLDVKVIERQEFADWIREKVTYRGALDKTAIAYIYLPKGVRPPYQVVHFLPAGDVSRGLRTLPMSMESMMGGLIRGGRAAFGVVLEGYRERNDTNENGTVEDVLDLRRGLDYLTSRSDINPAAIGFLNPSADFIGYAVTAVDDRYDAVALIGSSFVGVAGEAPRDDRVHFIPRMRAPKLVIHGKYDEANPLLIDGQVVFELMRGEKELLTYDGGHVPSKDWLVTQLIAWYDRVMGPVGG